MMPAMNTTAGKSLQELLSGIAQIQPKDDCAVTGLTLNSKTAQTGDVFFALAGHKEHGLNYAAEAIEHGVCAVVWDKGSGNDDIVMLDNLFKHVPLIPVNNLKQKLGLIAERYYDEPCKQLTMIGITGTNGKTSCSHFLAQALNIEQKTAVIGTLGNGFVDRLEEASHTTPDAISLHGLLAEFAADKAKNVVMEVSSHGLSQGRVAGISYQLAIFTNLSRDHLDYHGDMASYGDAKKLLFQMPSLQAAVINVDDDFGRQIVKGLAKNIKVVRYGIDNAIDADVRASKIKADHKGLRFDVISPWGSGIVSSSLLGKFNVSNLLAVISALLSVGISFEEALARVSKLKNVPGRMQHVVSKSKGPLAVVDYAHTPDALAKALQSLREHIKSQRNSKIWCVFGCGGDRDQGKRPLMGEVAEQYADRVIITDDNPRTEAASHIVSQILDGILKQQNVTIIHDRVMAIKQALELAAENDAVLIAGKGHEDYQVFGKQRFPYKTDAVVVQELLNAQRQHGGE